MVSFKLKVFLLVGIITAVVILFSLLNLPASVLVLLALLPCMIYSLFSFHGSHKWFLFLLTLLTFVGTVGLFIALFLGYAPELGETTSMIAYLVAILFPFRMDADLLSLLGPQVLVTVCIVTILIFLCGWAVKTDEFKLAIAGSYFLAFFTSFFLFINVFCYLIPPLQDFILSSPGVNWVLMLFYGILPFFIFTLSVLWLICQILAHFQHGGVKEKLDRVQDTQRINKQLNRPTMGRLTKWFILFMVIALAVIIIACVILV